MTAHHYAFRRLIIKFASFYTLQAVRELISSFQSVLLSIDPSLGSSSLTLILKVILTDYLVEYVLQLTTFVIKVPIKNLIILLLRLSLPSLLTAKEYLVGVCSWGRKYSCKVVPSSLCLRTRDVNELSHQTEFFQMFPK